MAKTFTIIKISILILVRVFVYLFSSFDLFTIRLIIFIEKLCIKYVKLMSNFDVQFLTKKQEQWKEKIHDFFQKPIKLWLKFWIETKCYFFSGEIQKLRLLKRTGQTNDDFICQCGFLRRVFHLFEHSLIISSFVKTTKSDQCEQTVQWIITIISVSHKLWKFNYFYRKS